MILSAEAKQMRLSALARITVMTVTWLVLFERNLFDNFIYQHIIKIHPHFAKHFAIKL